MYSIVKDWRNKRNVMYDPSQYSVSNYYTDIHQKKEMRHSFGDELLNNLHLLPDPLKKNLADSVITSEEPKQRQTKQFLNMEEVESSFGRVETAHKEVEEPQMAPFSGISSFFSGVMSVITGAMAQLRPRSPPKYYDCFDESNVSHQGSPPFWQPSNAEDQNKNEQANGLISNVQRESKSDMNKDCRSTVAQCEDKLKKVRLLLSSKPVETPKFRPRRPRKVFVEPGSVEESYEDAFAPEDFVSLSNDSYVEYLSPCHLHKEELCQVDSPRMRVRTAQAAEPTDIVTTLPIVNDNDKNCIAVNCTENDSSNCEPVKSENISEPVNNSTEEVKEIATPDLKTNESSENKSTDEKISSNDVPKDNNATIENKEELISSCEDKLSKLKALLQERRKKNTRTNQSANSEPESVDKTNDKVQIPSKVVPIEKSQDKRFKNPHRRTDKRKKTRIRKHIHDDMLFAHEINSDDLSSAENSPSMKSLDHPQHLTSKSANNSSCSLPETPIGTPKSSVTPPSKEFFDEISGRFRSTSTTDSDDSFQIVFTDSPKTTRARMPSDCDSEDSFIVFEDGPDSCYTTNDVFGEESEEESEYTDSDSDDSDSGCVSKLAHNLSRTIGDLTDTSLYEDNCVDEVDCAVRDVCEEIPSEDLVDAECVKDTGLLLTEAKKLLRKGQPAKQVQFSPAPPKVHVMRVWSFAARQARVGHWEGYARDRDRFRRRIVDTDMAISWVLKPQHRSRVMFQRFMPWWNQLRRKEIAERKQKKEEEERRVAEEKEREDERLEAEREARLKAEAEGGGNTDLVSGTDNVVNDIVNTDETNSVSVDSKTIVGNISNSDVKLHESETKLVCNGDCIKQKGAVVSKTAKATSVDKKPVVPIAKFVCNKIHLRDMKSVMSNKNAKDIKIVNGKTENGNINGKVKNDFKELKHNVIIMQCDKNKAVSQIAAKMIAKNGAIVQNGKIPNEAFNQLMCNDKMVNGQSRDIKLDLKKETVTGT